MWQGPIFTEAAGYERLDAGRGNMKRFTIKDGKVIDSPTGEYVLYTEAESAMVCGSCKHWQYGFDECWYRFPTTESRNRNETCPQWEAIE
jgi:hypothetical protein